MDITGLSLTTVTLFLPLVGVLVLIAMVVRGSANHTYKWTAFGFSIATFLASILMWASFDSSNPALQLVQRNAWLPSYGVSYYVGVDGISLLLVLLSTFIMPLGILSSFRAHVIHERGREPLYYI